MEVAAKGKFIRVSPKKAREIADLIRGKKATQAYDMIRFMPQGSAGIIGKVLKSAMANAENNFNLDKNELTIAKITIDGGPYIKRWQPRAKGAAYEIRKPTSHVTVVVAGEIKTKHSADSTSSRQASSAQEKAAAKKAEKVVSTGPARSEDQSGGEHKVEVERPEFMKKESVGGPDGQNAPKVDVKNKIFRRKAGM